MHQTHIFEFGVADALAVETRKQRRRTSAVETFVVIENSYPHKPFRLCGIPRPERASQNSASAKQKVGGNDIFGKGSEGGGKDRVNEGVTSDRRRPALTTRQNGLFDLHQLAGIHRRLRSLQGLGRSPEIHIRHLMHARDGAVWGATLFREELAPDIGNRIVLQRDRGIAALLRTVVHRSEEHTSELQSLRHLVCRLLLEKKKKT